MNKKKINTQRKRKYKKKSLQTVILLKGGAWYLSLIHI